MTLDSELDLDFTHIEKHEVSVDNLWTSGLTSRISQVLFGI